MEAYIERYRLALRYLMRQKKFTQGILAEKTGLSQAQISRILNHPRHIGSEEARRRIADTLGTSYEQMLDLGLSLMGRQVVGKAQDMKLLPNILFQDISPDASDIIEKVLYMDCHDRHSLRLLKPLLQSLCDDIAQRDAARAKPG